MPPVVVALAWDRLTPEGRALANKAAQGFVASRQGNELVGVFIVDQALRTVEGYTTDDAKLKAAVERVAGTATMPSGRAERDSRVAQSRSPGDGRRGVRRRHRFVGRLQHRLRVKASIRPRIGAGHG